MKEQEHHICEVIIFPISAYITILTIRWRMMRQLLYSELIKFKLELLILVQLLKTIRLLWHYRSKYEQLIDPSNNQIYKNLITFPNKTISSQYAGVIYKYVNGIFYDNMNEKEAEEVIETLKDLYRKFGLTKSFGVVTFNNKQKMLIERKIANLIQKEKKIRWIFRWK